MGNLTIVSNRLEYTGAFEVNIILASITAYHKRKDKDLAVITNNRRFHLEFVDETQRDTAYTLLESSL